jgi:hypothetical protein
VPGATRSASDRRLFPFGGAAAARNVSLQSAVLSGFGIYHDRGHSSYLLMPGAIVPAWRADNEVGLPIDLAQTWRSRSPFGRFRHGAQHIVIIPSAASAILVNCRAGIFPEESSGW